MDIKIQHENLSALINGFELNIYQKRWAKEEFLNILKYIKLLEKGDGETIKNIKK